MAIGRRRILGRAGAAVALASLSTPFARHVNAGPLRRVKIMLDYTFKGTNCGFLVAREKGFYEKAGLDAALEQGRGSGVTTQLLANKVVDFGFADGYVLGNAVSKGMALKMVAGVFRRNIYAIVVPASSRIVDAKGLEGHSVLIHPGFAEMQQWPGFAKGCGIDAGKVKILNADGDTLVRAWLNGQAEAVAISGPGGAPTLEIKSGQQARLFWYADCGVTAMSNGIAVHADLVKQDPELIKAVVRASLSGFLYARRNPDEAVEIIKKFGPATDPAITRREIELSWQSWVTPSTEGKPLGWMSLTDWKGTVENLQKYGGVSGPLDPAQLFTNDFVPADADFVPPQI